MKKNINLITPQSPVYKTLEQIAKTAKGVVFSGLPGVGKSLYINQFRIIAQGLGKEITVIQWDIARKSFETSKILERFPMGKGTVHDGVKLSAGYWLIEVLKNWLKTAADQKKILLIEAPLVGHRFIELAHIQKDETLEKFLKADSFQFIIPIPSKKVRKKIEADRKIATSRRCSSLDRC